MLKRVMLKVLTMKTGSYLPRNTYALNRRVLWKIFYGLEAENFDDDNLLACRIQVTKDMVVLLRLCEPSRRGNRVDWNLESNREVGRTLACRRDYGVSSRYLHHLL